MISCFKGNTSSTWENGINNTHAAVYTSVSDSHLDEVPKISKIIESLKHFDAFKYAAYRTAFKLRTIQKASKLYLVELSIINTVLHNYENGSSTSEETIAVEKAENLLTILYTEAAKKIGISEEPNVMSLLFLAFLQNTFVEADKKLLFFHMKVVLVLFSSAKLSEKYKYIFHMCSNGSTTMNKQNLELLLNCFAKMAEIVSEQVAFGSYLVPTAIKSLMKFCKNKITFKKFHKWLLLEPQTLVWISTLHRIASSENSQHLVHCDYCQVNPIVGFRYRCLQCITYNLCQNCFLCGYLNKKHKERHEVQEYCQPASAWDEAKAAINTLKNKISFARCPSKPYMSYDEESLYSSLKTLSRDPLRNSLMHLTLKKSTAAYIVKELSSIVNKLENDKEQIYVTEEINKENIGKNGQHKLKYKKKNKNVDDECLQNFKSSLDVQLDRLKELLKSLQTPVESPKLASPVPQVPFNKMDHYLESTPLNHILSPINTSSSNLPRFCDSENAPLELPRNNSTSLDFTNVISSYNSEDFTDSNRYSSALSMSKVSEHQSTSLELSKFALSSPLNLSERIPNLEGSKLSPLYLSSTSKIYNSFEKSSIEHCYSTTPMKNSVSIPSLPRAFSTYTLNKDQSIEAMELELQAVLQQIESLLPQVSILTSDSQSGKQKVLDALSDMESTVKKLSHISLTLSTGSTDL